MTKEQEEAIEILEGMVKSYIEADECGLSNNDFKHEIRAMQTVLSMLKHNSAEIEQKNTELAEKNAEIERLNRQIDLITEFLGERDLGYYKNETGGEILGIMRKYNKEDWKEHFERKATNNG